ncbi:MAG: glycosyltransferase family 4 protein [Myxococcota bacterium]
MALNVAVSREDVTLFQRFAGEASYLVIPNGVDTESFTPSGREPTGDMVFVGGYSWFPNADGMEYFTDAILPLIAQAEPQIEVKWIGKAPNDAHARFADRGVELLGYVDDIRPPMHDAKCSIVPLRVGGGTRLKILDAWALGKAVVSTSRGCEGLETRHGENILIADDPQAFADACLRVLNDPELRMTLERAGRKTVEEHYDWNALGERMFERYRSLLGKKS